MKFSKVRLNLVKEATYEYDEEKVQSVEDIVKCVNKIARWDLSAEEYLILVCLDSQNRIVCYSEIARGGISETSFDIKTIFKTVLMSNSEKFVIIHNHPGGTTEPSEADIYAMQYIMDMAEELEMELVDSIIIANDEITSCFDYIAECYCV